MAQISSFQASYAKVLKYVGAFLTIQSAVGGGISPPALYLPHQPFLVTANAPPVICFSYGQAT